MQISAGFPKFATVQRAFPFLILLAISFALAALAVGFYASRAPSMSAHDANSSSLSTATTSQQRPPLQSETDTPSMPAGLESTAHWTLDAIGLATWIGSWQAPSGPQHIVQDEGYTVWAFSGGGDIAWSLDMGGPIIGWGPIDARKDGHTQLLLADADKVQAVAISGADLADYPINPSVIITAMQVVDYDGNGNYRCLIGLQDGSLLNHKKSGMASVGWHHNRQAGAVQVIEHLRAGSKDYVCTVDAQGVVMLLKRTGQRRERTPATLAPMTQRTAVFSIASTIQNSVLITRKKDGSAVRVNFGSGEQSPASAEEKTRLEDVESPAMPAWLALTEDGPARY